MQVTLTHFYDEVEFLPWAPFIQMHTVINVSIDLLIDIQILIKVEQCGYWF
jgi:hypothetical protein